MADEVEANFIDLINFHTNPEKLVANPGKLIADPKKLIEIDDVDEEEDRLMDDFVLERWYETKGFFDFDQEKLVEKELLPDSETDFR